MERVSEGGRDDERGGGRNRERARKRTRRSAEDRQGSTPRGGGGWSRGLCSVRSTRSSCRVGALPAPLCECVPGPSRRPTHAVSANSLTLPSHLLRKVRTRLRSARLGPLDASARNCFVRVPAI